MPNACLVFPTYVSLQFSDPYLIPYTTWDIFSLRGLSFIFTSFCLRVLQGLKEVKIPKVLKVDLIASETPSIVHIYQFQLEIYYFVLIESTG